MKLNNFILPDGLTILTGGAFRGCESLTEITIPKGITAIGDVPKGEIIVR